jgi:type I restriction enzyme S subunit
VTARTVAEIIQRGSLVVNDGYRTKGSELGTPGIPILRVAEIGNGTVEPVYVDHIREEYRAAIGGKLSRAGDVLLTTKGTVGRRAVVPTGLPELVYSPQLCFFRVTDESLDAWWLYYWLGGSDFWLQANGVSTQTDMAPYISLRDLRAIKIDVPPIQEQRGIAETLVALDKKIDSNRRAISIALGLLDAMSVRFAQILPPVDLGSITALNRITVDPRALEDTKVHLYSLPAFDDGARPESVCADSIMSSKIAVSGRSVLVSRLNPRINRTWWIAPEEGVPALASTEFAHLTAESDSSSAALWLAVREPYFKDELVRRATGTSGSHQRVRPDDLLAIEVPDVRGLPEQTTKQALTLLELVHQLRAEAVRLAALRDVLLPELLSGRLRLRGARPEGATTWAP